MLNRRDTSLSGGYREVRHAQAMQNVRAVATRGHGAWFERCLDALGAAAEEYAKIAEPNDAAAGFYYGAGTRDDECTRPPPFWSSPSRTA